MFVYLNRKQRRALQDLIQQEVGTVDPLPRGSRALLVDTLSYLHGCIEEAACGCPHGECPCPDAGSTEAELGLADDYVAALAP